MIENQISLLSLFNLMCLQTTEKPLDAHTAQPLTVASESFFVLFRTIWISF